MEWRDFIAVHAHDVPPYLSSCCARLSPLSEIATRHGWENLDVEEAVLTHKYLLVLHLIFPHILHIIDNPNLLQPLSGPCSISSII